MFRFKKKIMVLFLSFSLIFLLVLLFTVDGDVNNLTSNKVVYNSNNTFSSFKKEKIELESTDEIKVEESDFKENNELSDNKEDSTNIEPEEVIEEVSAEPVVYDGLSLNELASKLERSMKNELSGFGYLYASYSLEKGVDPYLALAISLEETGCNFNCSNLVKSCNNVGGMKGTGCGAYGYFNTLDDGIRAFIDNIYKNYVSYGLNTADEMNPKYAENPLWSSNVNNYISIIRNN